MLINKGIAVILTAGALTFGAVASLSAQEGTGDYQYSTGSPDFVHGLPTNPEEAWLLAAGGRIYDNWWNALDVAEPKGTHPSYPEAGAKSGNTTWRCKECHGWDYQGKDGVYSQGSHYSGIVGINGAVGRPVEQIAALLRDDTHLYTTDMINNEQMGRIAAFVSRGQVDMSQYIDLSTREIIAGDINAGRGIFQTICAACHGFDGRLIDWGSGDENAYVGTESLAAPDEVLHKILSSHPGAAMVNLRAFGVSHAANVLAYAATLPVD